MWLQDAPDRFPAPARQRTRAPREPSRGAPASAGRGGPRRGRAGPKALAAQGPAGQTLLQIPPWWQSGSRRGPQVVQQKSLQPAELSTEFARVAANDRSAAQKTGKLDGRRARTCVVVDFSQSGVALLKASAASNLISGKLLGPDALGQIQPWPGGLDHVAIEPIPADRIHSGNREARFVAELPLHTCVSMYWQLGLCNHRTASASVP